MLRLYGMTTNIASLANMRLLQRTDRAGTSQFYYGAIKDQRRSGETSHIILARKLTFPNVPVREVCLKCSLQLRR
jgi:hypothetical protein